MRLSNNHLQTFEHDVNLSNATKAEVFKFLGVILKNLSKDDEKYRQLRMSNAKIQRMTSHAAITAFLASIGFQPTEMDGETYLKCHTPPSSLNTLVTQVRNALERVSVHMTSNIPSGNLSEKQKARMLKEAKAEKEKQDAQQNRKRTVAQIAADKHTRLNDPNWKPSVSAAAAKAGDAMQTFRDKFGE